MVSLLSVQQLGAQNSVPAPLSPLKPALSWGQRDQSPSQSKGSTGT